MKIEAWRECEPMYLYHATIRVDGLLWYHSKSQPSSQYYISQSPPVIHNYGLTLALAGYISDPDVGYASVFGMTRYKKPVELYKRYGIYAYPAVVTRAILGETLMAGNNEGLAMLRGQPRLAYPFFTKNVILMPGSILEALIISEEKMPDRLVTRIGAKRDGVILLHLKPVSLVEVEHVMVNYPFNLSDTVIVKGYTILLPHQAGDIAVFGMAEEALEYAVAYGGRMRRVILPLVKGVLT